MKGISYRGSPPENKNGNSAPCPARRRNASALLRGAALAWRHRLIARLIYHADIADLNGSLALWPAGIRGHRKRRLAKAAAWRCWARGIGVVSSSKNAVCWWRHLL